MLDLSKLAQEREILAPIFNNSFQYHHKKYSIDSPEGWYKIKIQGNKAFVIEQVYDFTELEEKYKTVKGYTYNNTIVFHNFDVAKRKWKFEVSRELLFNTSQTFSAIKAIVWEDKNIYFTQPDYSNYQIFEIKSCFDNDGDIKKQKGMTPELRTLFLFHSIERDAIREIEKKQRAEEEEKRLMNSIPGRLKLTFERAGAVMTNYSLSGRRIVVDWKMPGSNYTYNSVIDSRTFKVLEAGYCMSNDDKRHNITSLVKTAEEYEEKDLTYITRS